MDAAAPLFILYTSSSTGSRGVLHATGGYPTHVTTTAVSST
jgi:acyl-coenzyme A synthetase/AMP-(fatty) acid ligase